MKTHITSMLGTILFGLSKTEWKIVTRTRGRKLAASVGCLKIAVVTSAVHHHTNLHGLDKVLDSRHLFFEGGRSLVLPMRRLIPVSEDMATGREATFGVGFPCFALRQEPAAAAWTRLSWPSTKHAKGAKGAGTRPRWSCSWQLWSSARLAEASKPCTRLSIRRHLANCGRPAHGVRRWRRHQALESQTGSRGYTRSA